MTPARAVSRYISSKRKCARDELRSYAKSTLAQTISAAASSMFGGKRASHQRRIPGAVLRRACARLVANKSQLRRAGSFAELLSLTDALLRKEPNRIRGIGELTVYDIAHRIGYFLGLEPKLVYLHAGARVGARVLGVENWRAPFVSRSDLPSAFRRLTPVECENCLCIFFSKSGGHDERAIPNSRHGC